MIEIGEFAVSKIHSVQDSEKKEAHFGTVLEK